MDSVTTTITGTETIAELIYQFGPAVIIVSVFLVLFITILFYIMRQQQKSNENIMKEHQLLIQNLVEYNMKEPPLPYVSDSKKDHDTKEIMNIYLKIKSTIKIQISQYMVDLQADRIAIYLFHNGMKAINGFPFLKFSCIGEQSNSITNSRIKQHHDFPVNLMTDFLKDLFDHKPICYYDDNDINSSMEEDPMFEKLISSSSNKYIVKGIFDSEINLIGFIIVEFDAEQLKPYNYINKNTEVDNLIEHISPVLEFSDFNNLYQGGVE